MSETPRTAVVLTVGNELLSGDVDDTNAPWLCRRLAGLGVEVKLVASVRDDIEEIADVAAVLRARFEPRGLGDYAARWAQLPEGSQPISNPLGGAPGFSLENVYVFPGLPREMEAMFDSIAERFQGRPIASWRRSYRTGEGQIVRVLEEAVRLHPGVTVGSYPRFLSDGPEVEVVLKSSDDEALQEAAEWVEGALEAISSRGR